jgi:hypothetical protein
VLQLISVGAFEAIDAIGICPIERIGVAARCSSRR